MPTDEYQAPLPFCLAFQLSCLIILQVELISSENSCQFEKATTRINLKKRQLVSNDYSSLVQIAWTFYMLHGNMQANILQNMENSGSLHGNIFRIKMQPPLFELKRKTIPLLHRRDHIVFTRKFLR